MAILDRFLALGLARSAISWMKRLLEEGDQGSQHGWACKDLEQDCEEGGQHCYFQSVGEICGLAMWAKISSASNLNCYDHNTC